MAGRVKWFFRNLFWDLATLTEWWPWLSSWFDTWSVLCDEEVMKAINDIKKWEAEGTLLEHTVPLSEVMEKAGITQEELDSIPEPEVDRHGDLVFLPSGKIKPQPFDYPKPRRFNEATGREVKS